MPREISLKDVKNLIGTEVGISEWLLVDQAMINMFADATHDHQFIHVDPERAAREGPFGGTIAHGFLTLSLLSALNYDAVPRIREQVTGLNYGFDKIRFVSPVRAGKQLRGQFVLADARFRGAGMIMLTYEVTVEIEGERKPALTATWSTLIQFDPKDRPEDA